VRPATFLPNTSTKAQDDTLTVVIRGITTTVDHLKVVEAAPSSRTPRYCVGPASCAIVLPAPDELGLAALEVGYVKLNVACPEPGKCDEPVGDQLDAVVVVMKAGSSGLAYPSYEMANFTLILPDGSQAQMDAITCDTSVEYALCAVGPEGPNAVFGTLIFYDAPMGSVWSSVNFRYYSGGTSEVYVFHR
jgi:hypothetical protein